MIAIYEYKPNRADELHIYPNDKIKVLYEDGRDWWMWQLEDGQQGYFPSSYVLNPGSSQLTFTCLKSTIETLEKDAIIYSNTL